MSDPIVRRIPIFFTSSLTVDAEAVENPSLYLLQYPISQNPSSGTSMQHRRMSVKPASKTLNAHTVLDSKSAHYHRDRGISYNHALRQSLKAESKSEYQGYEEDVPLDGIPLTSQLVKSESPAKDPVTYRVGVLIHGELHMSPLNAIVQLRPDMTYLDALAAKEKQTFHAPHSSAEDDSAISEVEMKQPAAAPKKTLQKVKDGNESKVISDAALRESNQRVLDEEESIPINYHDEYSQESELARGCLYARNKSDLKILTTLEEYVECL